jgi:lipopolysaccharide assembly LptE-like protein
MKFRIPFLVALLMFGGCAGYHLGPIAPSFMKGVKTVAVPTFKNETLEPRIEVLVADDVIKQLQQDGTFQVASSDKADAILQGTIRRINRRTSRSLRGNVLATREFTLTVLITYTLTRRSTKELLDERQVQGTTSFFVSEDVQQNERQALTLAFQDAAQRLVSGITEGW